MKILTINPGDSSTKISVFEDETPLLLKSLQHSVEELPDFSDTKAQYVFRKRIIEESLSETGIPMQFDAIIGRGGLVKPIQGGVYEVTDKLYDDVLNHAMRQHPCNLGTILAYEMAKDIKGCRAFMADPGIVDELGPLARYSGTPLLPRIAFWHALNQKAISREYAKSIGRRYEDLRLIVCHMGSGISVAVHVNGKAIDVNNALDGEGSFSVKRSGTLPVSQLIHLCFSGKYTEEQLQNYIMRECGLTAYVGHSDMPKIMQQINDGDLKAKEAVDAMIYQTAKNIAALTAVIAGKPDAILITGGLAHVKYITDGLESRISWLAPVHIFPGEDEQRALALNALAVLRGERQTQPYK